MKEYMEEEKQVLYEYHDAFTRSIALRGIANDKKNKITT